ncbi:SDR family oxidoreductase [Metabacillus sp. GX 13764]|uniref:SDR family oxidoreductase n=1 Tax=Metabacillus kandeliae TaxID=2900151 RepID=UPI001E4633CF|nr:SDR family oxidoreductase [Metabacillus kandeliae]MCD7036523.1 SDR family oxidoreductase [Metabacillus kandeliae]
MRLKGKTALVTGGSRGLGKAVCASLAAEGAKVIINYFHNSSQANDAAEEIRQQGGTAFAVKGDVTDEKGAASLIAESKQLLQQPVDILVNNATGPQPELSLEEASWKDYEDQLVFFVKAPLLLMKAVLPDMKESGGSVINIGSEVVQLGNSSFSNYVTAKSAMLGMTRSWASELGAYGIRVNLLNPGFVPVERHEGVGQDALMAYQKNVPLGRMGIPADIGSACVFLASDESSFITGQSLSVNGGNTFGI